jgi:hypothetical protein
MMRKFTIHKPMASSVLMMLMILSRLAAIPAPTHDLPIKGSDVVRCGAGELTLTVSWSDIALNPDNVKWYTVPFYGEPIATGLSYETGYIEFTQTYFVDYIGEDGCSQCDRLLVRAVILDQVTDPQIIYSSYSICNSDDQNFVPTIIGATGGTFEVTAKPDGGNLMVNEESGIFNPVGVIEGTYQITFTPEEVLGCNNEPVAVEIGVSQAPGQPEISYAATEYCTIGNDPTPDITGETGGFFTASPSGLMINPETGMINLSESTARQYTITYRIPGRGGCSPAEDHFILTVVQYPSASIAYAQAGYTKNVENVEVILDGDGDYAGGVFNYSAANGGTLNVSPTTGALNPSDSDAGVYTLTYTKNVTGTCEGTITAQTSVEIFPLPSASIAGTTWVCQNADPAPEIIFTGSHGTPPYTFGYTINQGILRAVTSEESSETAKLIQSSEEVGTYTYTLVSVTDGNGSLKTFDTPDSEVITIIAIPSAEFVYLAAAYCQTGTATPELSEGAEAGIFTASPAGLVFTDQNAQGESPTGSVDLAATAPGSYIITHAIDICGMETATTTIAVSEPPTVDIVGNVTMTYGDVQTYSGPEGENYSYQWEVIGVATFTSSASERNVNVQATDLGQFTLELTVTNAIGCAGSDTKNVTVDKAELLVIGTQHTKDYDRVAISTSDLGHVFSGFVFDDDEAVVSGSVAYAGGEPDAIGAVDAGEYSYIPDVSALSADNYTFTPAYGSYTINPLILSITADDKTVHYGDPAPEFTYTLSGFVNEENAVSLRNAGKLTGEPILSSTYTNTTTVSESPLPIIVEGLGTLSATNYIFSVENMIDGEISINKAPLSVTADDLFIGFGEPDPGLTVTYSGFVNDEDEIVLDGTLTVEREAGTATGTYTITPSGDLSSGNYDITFHTGTLTIANVVLEATLGTTIAGYANLSEAFDKINDGTHKGEITISIYADLTEPEPATQLLNSGEGDAEYISVTIIAANDAKVTGEVIIGGDSIVR